MKTTILHLSQASSDTESPSSDSDIDPLIDLRGGIGLLRGCKEAQSTKDGFLPQDKILDFLRKVSRADVADGAAGRLWKAQMVMTPGFCGDGPFEA